MFTGFVDGWWAWMAAMSWQVVVVVLAVWLVSACTRKRSARWHHGLWLLVFLKLVLPPQWGHEYSPTAVAARYWTRPAATIGPARALPIAPMPAVAAQESTIPVVASAPSPVIHAAGSSRASPAVSSPIAWPRARTMLFWLWATGVLLLSARASRARRRFAVALRQRATPPCGALQAELEAAAQSLSLRGPLRACMVDGLSAPCVLGWLRPCLVLPGARLIEMSPVQRRMVLEHELLHVRRFDPLVNGLANLLVWAYWFHPLAWWAERQLRLAREMAVDEGIALAHGVQEYGETLLIMSRSRPTQALPAAVGLGEAGSPLLARVRRLALHPPRRYSLRATLLLALGLGAVACAGLPLAVPKASTASNASSFDGVHDFVRIDPSASLDLRGSLTLSARVKVDGDQYGDILWRGDLRSGLDPYQMNVTDHRIEFRIDSAPHERFVRSAQPVDDRWHFWTGVYDADAGRLLLYCDGVLDASEPVEGRIDYDTSEMWNVIGAFDNGAYGHFCGEIAEVQLWNGARSSRQIQADMKNRLRRGAPGLAGWWDLASAHGDLVADRSGNNNHGRRERLARNVSAITPAAPPARPQPRASNATATAEGMRFDDRGDCIKIAPAPSLDLTGSLTLSARVKVVDFIHGQILFRGDFQSGRDPYQMNVTDHRIEFRIGSSPREPFVRSAQPVDDGWHFWTGVYDAEARRLLLYRDGVFDASVTAENPIDYATSKMWNMIGAVDNGGWGHLGGEIGEIQIWKGSRSAAQIEDDMKGRLRPGARGLAGWWLLSDLKNGTLPDRSGNGADGKLQWGPGDARLHQTRGNEGMSRPGASPAALPDFDVPGLQGLGRGLKLDGRGAFVEILSETPMPSTQAALTVECWLYLPNYPRNDAHLVSQWGAGLDEDDALGWKIGPDGTMQVELNPSRQAWSPNTILATNEPLPLKEWTHVAFTWSGADRRLTIYMKGRKVATTDQAVPTLAAVAEPWRVGTNGHHTAGNDLRGAIAMLRIWNVERTGEQIAAASDNRRMRRENGLIGWWNFDEVQGERMDDRSSVGNSAWIRHPSQYRGVTTK